MATAAGGHRNGPRSQHHELRQSELSDVKFVTVAEVAQMMRVSKMTVYRLVHAGDLPAIRVGRSFRVPEEAVHDYLRHAFIEAG
jgi:excisionase family DNA binding protein